ncbi:HDOD domain-containing protein [Cycloclasticus pugetii]|uniref:HDOD domain-containing protein n=1 Tax=Cycloclasticus pugetii TaxID=34068 RepID=UPI00091748C3|nr:HDOD domain-containing protein [Cycloclasticus pugetii]SHJ01715.1 HD-like signal output (HDOD) domain, no enzymatic activity [Cycloclasticus pugetii]
MTQTYANICTVDDFLTGDIDLCSAPEIFYRITQALDDPLKNSQDIAAIIEQDPSLSARMLKIVNSAFFGFPASIKTIEHAISILGNHDVRMLVMTTSVVEKFSTLPNSILDMRQFWMHSLKTALFAKYLADNHPKKRQLSSAFMSGLLHDIGRLIFYIKAPDLARAAALLVKTETVSEIEAEASFVGFNHAELGGALLKLWEIPASIQDSASFHHQPDLATNNKDEVYIVYLANKLTHANSTSEETINKTISTEDNLWNQLDLPYGIIAPAANHVDEQFSQTYALFFD